MTVKKNKSPSSMSSWSTARNVMLLCYQYETIITINYVVSYNRNMHRMLMKCKSETPIHSIEVGNV